MTVFHLLPKDIKPGIFIKRINRFVALVQIENKEELVHVPSSGRMQELLIQGAGVYLAPGRGAGRKTRYSLILVRFKDTLVSIDSLLPNRLVKKALSGGELPPFRQFGHIRPEYKYGHSRFDFYLNGSGAGCLLEVKSVTLVEKGAAMFPDAPSQRGARHLEELTTARKKGFEAAVLFIVQRSDGIYFAPNSERDPAFSAALREAYGSGVKVYAYSCNVSLDRIELGDSIPVCI